MGCFVESKILKCVLIFIILCICVNLTRYSKTKVSSAEDYKVLCEVFFISLLSQPHAQRVHLQTDPSWLAMTLKS